MKFDSFGFNPSVADGIRAQGYEIATPIQAQGIPPVMEGRDIIGLAQTGTGKTAVFVLPILEKLMVGPRNRVRALVLAPTRELAEQTNVFFGTLGRQTYMRSMSIYGGVKINPQIDRLRSGVEIVVACPGRLLDHINRGTIDLSQVEVLVLDEADRMCDMGFLPDVRRIMEHLPRRRQTLLFSATMPRDIRRLADDILRNPVTVQVDHELPLETVSHTFYPVKQHLKTDLLMEVLQRTDTGPVLVFSRTKHRAKRLGQQLYRKGYKATSLQGNMSQGQRQDALDGFKSGRFQILVATDIAARGIDVSNISHVINYDVPDTADTYTHRIGRTGRASRTGEALTFITDGDGGIVRSIERHLGSSIERRTFEDFDYDKPGSRPQYNGPGQRPTGPRPHRQREQSGNQKGSNSGDRPRNHENRPDRKGPNSRGQPMQKSRGKRHGRTKKKHHHHYHPKSSKGGNKGGRRY
jgi:ATP-dependent RNA helicase RhlE